MIDLKQYEVWFVTGSQHLYGPKTLEQVAAHSQEIAQALSASALIPVKVVFKPVLTTPEAIHTLCLEANAAANCIGLKTTFTGMRAEAESACAISRECAATCSSVSGP